MAVVVPNAGAQEILKRATNNSATGDLTLCLYSNDYTPIETSVIGSFTEATFTGYAAAAITGATATITNADPSEASWSAKTFTSSAGSQNQSIYGYYVRNAGSTVALWAERFTDGPYVIVNNGDTITVTPKLTLD